MSDAHHSAGGDIVIDKVRPQETGRLLVITSPALDDHAFIGDPFSAYHDNISPALSWTEVLEAESFALIVEDPDAPMEEPFIHWMIWNIPGAALGLPQGVQPAARINEGELKGAIQGANTMHQHGYMGPRPPVGHGVHHYHFQLFALRTPLDLPPETPLPKLLNALKGLTIASADMVGLYEARDAI